MSTKSVPDMVDDVLQRHHAELLSQMQDWLHNLELKLQKYGQSDPRLLPHPLYGPAVSHGQDSDFTRQKSKEAVTDEEGVSKADDEASAREESSDEGNRHHVEAAEQVPTLRKPLSRSESYETAKMQATYVESWKNLISDSLDLDKTGLGSLHRKVSAWAYRLANSTHFNAFFAIVILTNSVYLGAQVELTANSGTMFVHPMWFIIHLVYVGLFSVEIMIRILAVGPISYVCGSSWAWHWLDIVAVMSSWVELAADLLDNSGTYSAAASNFRIMRIFRITRLVKVVRSLSLVRFIGALRTLVYSIADTTKSLVWALLLLLLIQYTFGILFTDAALDHIHSADAVVDAEKMRRYFGNVWTSTETLFRSLLGGIDWGEAADALMPLGEFWVRLFDWYIAFCSFAVLNVMTGTFCHSAIKAAEHDHQTIMQNRKRFKSLLSDIFSKMDVTGDGKITISDFEKLFEDEDMRAFFETIEIDAVDAWTLFASLDVDGDYIVSLEEFTERCMQLHGPARSVDLYAMKQQNLRVKQELQELIDSQKQANERLNYLLHVVIPPLTPLPSVQGITTKASFEV
ncbi:Scn11a [Symbiodinium necroappetens]|uniref:Scn11a protein n=1 Tax=Symbiodinium necroappetens TaxID=1628268 RepID=A0A812JE36_9DINO|nr:Scn11a [Symbiodinium necroappetens]|mmetsp:Transcript_94225/g.224304  ORF Transcript_94225/g.224304 Transcript_94225/m.224304 type:complete len:572 (+) Transcript_94225:45-1760(+)|eukprot:CAMPEP_0181419008 /NCGR_PEP_ID=MMETSP1110-20121109/11853_1 /TAXON_ID=174948 /ORGANISM="Symbiodinium sp., Strain CCMP421" /LENGTH=571 /DNA_ID=CAMNT_0023542013 /DNA_START=40 /DNA_END=1755 /DNA_ORIENTATION=+